MIDKTLYIVRGLPGSGKTTLAKRLTSEVFEADQFFEGPDGYAFDATKLSEAHAACQARVKAAMLYGRTKPVLAVSNTFTRQWEIAPYRLLAATYGYTVVEITMSGPLYPNIHGVPDDAIQRMRERWEVTDALHVR